MLKTFLLGILLGALAAAGVLYAFPVVDQSREVSIVSVAPNGGNHETFVIKIPQDRVMVGAPGYGAGVPVGVEWPDEDALAGITTEMFKLRNTRNAVIGVAARTIANDGNADVTQWVMHLPARGTLFVDMDGKPLNGGPRVGRFRAGTREFGDLTGAMAERWVDAPDDAEGEGRIELLATYISIADSEYQPNTEPAE